MADRSTRDPGMPAATSGASRPDATAATLHAARPILLEATRLAWDWHGHQTRKGRTTSYMSHLLAVQGLVIRAGGGPTESIAALLHDALEDAESPRERAEREGLIDERFGTEVLRIVLDCTDTTPAEAGASKGPWRERKERYLTQLAGAAAPSRLVAACDKRHNLGELVDDLRHEGKATLERFNAGAAEQVWYFDAMARVCRDAIPGRLARELDELVEALRELADVGRA
ncbi:MAG: HD domain-containing protein [Myxococcota bacterium]